MRRPWLILGLLLAAAFLFGVWTGTSREGGLIQFVSDGETSSPVFSYGYVSESLYERANQAAVDVVRTGARSGIAAHHLLVGDKIAQLLASLGTGTEKTVVILSPNHFSQGRSAMQTTYGSWETPGGELLVDQEAVDVLRAAVDLTLEPETFKTEHGVAALTPFVKTWFPDARLVPLVIHDKATPEQVSALAAAIEDELPDAIVIASIDMSHNLPEHIQTFHDEVTQRTIAQGRSDLDLEVDANNVLRTLFEVNRLRGTQSWTQTHHGSSLAMGATSNWRENTSHILGYFLDGEPVDDPFVSLHFVGDVMLDRGVRTKIESQGVDYPWQEVERYLQGAHLRVANFEGTISEETSVATEEPPFRFTFAPEFVEAMLPFIDVVSLANNHSCDRDIDGELETQTWLDELEIDWFGGYATAEPVYRFGQVSLIGYHEFGTSIDDLLPVIQEENRQGQFVIVMPHWGEEYVAQPQEGQRELATKMIQAGADLIVGSHPHVIQGIELIDGVPVIYSLGNFIFDQVEPGTDVGMSATVLLEDLGGMIYLSPVATLNGQPVPLSDEEAQIIFAKIASLSTEELAPHILTGLVPFSYDRSKP
jgi:poly-gamma-glutamate synthesis protein (capsule biosynthesis protein)